MPKVLHIVTSLAVGGAQNHLKTLVAGLAAHGWHSDIVYFKDPALLPELTPLADTVRQVPLGKASLPYALWQLVRIIKAGNYAIVHTHLLKADAMGALAAAPGAVPVISTKHNDERALLNPIVSVIHGLLAHLNSRTIVISQHVGSFMRSHGRVPPDKLTHIPYGLPWPEQLPAAAPATHQKQRQPRFVSIGRLDPQKGYETLLRAAALVLQQVPDFELWIVGDTQHGGEAYLTSLHTLTSELRVTANVKFLGVRADVDRLLAQADGFVLASRWEGFGLVFLEAMAAGKPVVATRVSAIPEVVEDNVTGLLVPPDDPAALAGALLELIRDPAQARQMGKAGHARVHAHFSAAAMIAKTAAVYAACSKQTSTTDGPG